MTVRIVLLGSGAVRPVPGRAGPAQVVVVEGEPLLFDCGHGAATGLRRAGIAPEVVNRVFLTHLHFDHTSDLPFFILVTWVMGREQPLEVYGPSGTAAFIASAVRSAYEEDIRSRLAHGRSPLGLEPHITEITEPGVFLSEPSYRVSTFPVRHGGMQNLGYRIETAGRTVVILGDVSRGQDIVKFVVGADVLLCECSGTEEFLCDPARRWGAWHMTPEAVAALASAARVRTLVLKHFVMEDEAAIAKMGKEVRPQFPGEVLVGGDGLEVVLD
jgi:ribonuclease Z